MSLSSRFLQLELLWLLMQSNYRFSIQSTLNGDILTSVLSISSVYLCISSIPTKQSWTWHSTTHHSSCVLGFRTGHWIDKSQKRGAKYLDTWQKQLIDKIFKLFFKRCVEEVFINTRGISSMQRRRMGMEMPLHLKAIFYIEQCSRDLLFWKCSKPLSITYQRGKTWALA